MPERASVCLLWKNVYLGLLSIFFGLGSLLFNIELYDLLIDFGN